MLLYSALTICQPTQAATYTPPALSLPGTLQFDNIQVDASGNFSADLMATDNERIYAGQVFQLKLDQLGSPSGEQDATYDSLSQKIEAQEFISATNQEYSIILQLTRSNSAEKTFEFTVIELRNNIFGDNKQLLEQITSFMPGPKGDTGARGSRGSSGAQGIPGSTGTQGASGKDGVLGPQGNPGVAGAQGAIGPHGAAGASGLAGVQGIQGSAGPAGGAGTQGVAGAQGQAGPQGPIGAKGDRGQGIDFLSAQADEATIRALTSPSLGDVHLALDTGDLWVYDDPNNSGTPDWHDIGHTQGPVGPTGLQGIVGQTGLTGSQGVIGPKGPAGAQGTAGAKGDAEVVGATGAQGPIGVTGPIGATGPAGTMSKSTFYAVNANGSIAKCRAGDQVISGGATCSTVTAAAITESHPLGNLSGWFAICLDVDGTSTRDPGKTHVLCADITP